MPKKITTEDFIQKSKKVHGDKYDYSITNYINQRIKVVIICKQHGEFTQNPTHHMNGFGCSICSGKKKMTKQEFIEKCKKVHGDRYDYSRVEYINIDTKIKIICPLHGEFEQRPYNHIGLKHGCTKCSTNKRTDKKRMTKDDFIEKSLKIHGSKYLYDNVIYGQNNKTKIDIICKIHGVFKTKPNNHLSGYGCPSCSQSKGELKILEFLKEHNVNFVRQKTFNGCRYVKLLKFDFYLPEYNTCIEYDGEQHYKPINFFGGEEGLKLLKIKDNIKNEFCLKNNMKLIRIKYDEDLLNIMNNIVTIEKVNNISSLKLSR